MDQYKISQTPTSKKPPKIKNFWVPQAQQKKLSKKTVIITISSAFVVIVVGAVFATIRLRGQVVKLHSPYVPINGGTQAETIHKNNVYSIPSAVYSAVTTAISSKNPSLLGAYYASQVHVIIVNSLINETVGSANAASIISAGLAGASTPWNFHVPPSEISAWQQGPDGQYFDGIDLIGISSNGDVISIGFDNSGQIDSVFVAPVDTLTTPSSDSSSGSNDNGPSTIPTPTDTNSTD